MTVDVIAAARRRTRRLVIAFLGVCGGLALLIYPAGLYVDAHLRPSTPMVSASVGPTGSGSASLSPPSRGVLPTNTMWMQLAGVTRFAACEFSLVWSAGDWRLVAPSGGRWDAHIHVVDNGDIGRWSPIRAG